MTSLLARNTQNSCSDVVVLYPTTHRKDKLRPIFVAIGQTNHGHFGPWTLWTLDTSALVWWVRTVRADWHWCRSVLKTVQTYVLNCLPAGSEVCCPIFTITVAWSKNAVCIITLPKSSAVAEMGDCLAAIDMGQTQVG